MSTPEGEYYTDERWQNWLDRLDEEGVDLEDENSARLRMNLQDDAVIAVAKVVSAYDEGDLDEEAAMEEIEGISDIVLTEVDIDDEETLMLIDAVQTALVCVFHAAQEYVVAGVAGDGTPEDHIEAARNAEAEEDVDAAHVHCVTAGTLIIDGADLDVSAVEDIEYGLVAEWVDGLNSLHEALRDPEVIEDDEE
ncbi:DUF2150 family protein [Halomarina ordinaria]|uniref:DUF2150 family protein n=1 Tax=Halomarina ordinaria TaxID=3033939 RepID=A0ABD5UBC1_9EURY|nr:DUF2150 family protein [Halomarina sp. PSRA2]